MSGRSHISSDTYSCTTRSPTHRAPLLLLPAARAYGRPKQTP
jgi:hypothetical protein